MNPFYKIIAHHALWVNYLRQKDYANAYQETLKFNRPQLFWDHLAKAATFGLLGKIIEGREAAAELLIFKPDFHERGRMLIRHCIKFNDIVDRVIDGLESVGIAVA